MAGRFVVILICCAWILAPLAHGQTATTSVLVACDVKCRIVFDGELVGELDADGAVKVPTGTGDHLLTATSIDQKNEKLTRRVSTTDSKQVIVEFRFLELRAAKEDAEKARKAAERERKKTERIRECTSKAHAQCPAKAAAAIKTCTETERQTCESLFAICQVGHENEINFSCYSARNVCLSHIEDTCKSVGTAANLRCRMEGERQCKAEVEAQDR